MAGEILLGIIFGLVAGLLLVRVFAPWVARRILRRRTPPVGTRPHVHMLIDGVRYDLTESLVRAPDDADGWAVWAVLGPQRVRLKPGNPGALIVATPAPRHTHIRLMVTGPPEDARFYTEQEIRDELGVFEPQP